MPTPNRQKDGTYSSLTGFHRAVPIILFALSIFIALCFFTKNTGALGGAIGDFLLGSFSVGAYFIPLFLAIHAFFYASDIQLGKPLQRALFTLAVLALISALAHAIANFGNDPIFDAEKFYDDGINSTGGGFVGGLISYIIMKMIGPVGLVIVAATVFAIYIAYSLAGKDNILKKGWDKLVYAVIQFGAKKEKQIKANAEARKARKEEAKLNAQKARLAKDSALYNDDFFAVDNGIKELHIEELGIRESRSDDSIAENPHLQEKVHLKSVVSGEKLTRKEKKALKKRAFTPDYVARQNAEDPKSVFTSMQSNSTLTFDDNPENVFTEDFIPLDIAANEKLAAKHSSMTIKAAELAAEAEKPKRRLFSDDEVTAARRRAEFEFRKNQIKKQREADKAAEATTFAGESITVEQPKESPIIEQNEPQPIIIDVPIAEDIFEPQYSYAEPARNENLEDKYKRTAGYASVINEFPRAEEEKRIAREQAEMLERKKQEEERIARERAAEEQKQREIEEQRARDLALAEERLAKEKELFEAKLAEERALAEKRARKEAEEEYASRLAAEVSSQRKLDDIARIFEEEIQKTSTPKNEIGLKFTTDDSSETQVFNFDGSGNLFEESAPSVERNEYTVPKTEPKIPFVSNALPDMIKEDVSPYESARTANDDFIFEPEDDENENDDIFTEPIPESEQNPQINEYRKMFSMFDDEKPTSAPAIPVLGDYTDYEKPSRSDDIFSSISSNENMIDDEFIPGEEDDDIRDTPEDDFPPFDFEPTQIKMEEPEIKAQEKPDYSNYQFPSIELLAKGVDEEDPTIEEEISETGDKLIDTLAQFNVRASIKSVDRGPRITRYEIVPARGVRVSSVMSTENDIKLNLAAEGLRMEAPIPGKSAIGVEVPNQHPSNVYLRDLLESDEFTHANSKTYCCIGKDVTGNPVFGDIAKMPHVLVAGATGMGKSVCINSILISILYKAKPDEVKFIMVDPKTVEFTMYNGIPHLLVPVVTDVKQAAGALMWAIDEMNRRYELMAKHEVRQLDSYNELVRQNPSLGEKLPKIIIVIDELNDLMQQVRKPVEGLITNITQKARAAGIHMIIGTQRPSVDVITGVIKANVPSRISCKVTSFNDSKTILDKSGAEKLLDKGDMLFAPVGKSDPLRVQGAFVSDGEVEKVMKFLKSNVKGNIYDEQALEDMTRAAQKCSKGKDSDDDFDSDEDSEEGAGYLNDKQFLEAVDLAVKQGKISTSLIQRKISIGYGKAAKFIDIMEDMGLVSEPNGQKPRDVLVTRDEWREMLSRRSLDD